MTNRIVIEAEKQSEITVSLVGKEYLVTPPKGTYGIALAKRVKSVGNDAEKQWEILMSWLDVAFGKKQSSAIQKRLEDPKDPIDIPHLTILMEKLTQLVTENPTT